MILTLLKYQMYEAFMLFESICNSKWFINTSMILFLNKVDLFKSKLSRSAIADYFPDYRGNIYIYMYLISTKKADLNK
jgi:guanine nucleotide-binding protein subunit alpha